MSFFKSLFLGSDGAYNVFGLKVNFLEEPGCQTSSVNRILNAVVGQYPGTFFHELGHAFAARWLLNSNGISVEVYRSGGGYTRSDASVRGWRDSAIMAAGPLAQSAFSISALVAGLGLDKISTAISLSFSSMGMANMLFLIYEFFLKDPESDWNRILKNSKYHHVIAVAALASQVALGTFLASQI